MKMSSMTVKIVPWALVLAILPGGDAVGGTVQLDKDSLQSIYLQYVFTLAEALG